MDELERASLKFARKYAEALAREKQEVPLPFLLYLAERWRRSYLRKFVLGR